MSWLVLASGRDEAGRWAAEGLAGAGLEPVCFVTDTDLAGAVWSHCIGGDSVATLIELADGRTIDSADVRGTLNRLTHVPPDLVGSLVVEDRQYALQELSALVMSWLASLPSPTINPPDTRGLSGAWRSPAEWAMLAGEAGLDAAPVMFDSAGEQGFGQCGWHAWGPGAPFVEDVIVVGDVVFAGVELARSAVNACGRLATLSATPLLGVAFADGGTSPVIGITPLPDLRAGGDAMIAALVEALAGERGDG